MRLYLSSFRLGDHPDTLLGLAPPPGPALVFANAIDGVAPADRKNRVDAELQRLTELGYHARGYAAATCSPSPRAGHHGCRRRATDMPESRSTLLRRL